MEDKSLGFLKNDEKQCDKTYRNTVRHRCENIHFGWSQKFIIIS